ncbi:nucleic acid/nucleotide deaminase domain-containing protein [Mesorhizobium sp. 1B3]|uniref:nucleic acid/nucleotide deaminase domain-containing protein n=1 Tax=Mesorhizobium sp. 1B3 TaxID=3243599 RepID=UPI003D968149
MATFSNNTRLDYLDRVAIAILNEGHRMMADKAPIGKKTGSPSLKTSDATLRCVAVMEIGATLLIAANNFFVTKQHLANIGSRSKNTLWKDHNTVKNNLNKGDPIADSNLELFDIFSATSEDSRNRLGYDRAIFVTGVHTYMNNYHAEMQLLQFMLDHKLKAHRRYIGVSKPCCPECAAVLKRARISFSEGHTKNAHGVRNVANENFSHPHFASDLAERLGLEVLSGGGAREAPW